MPFPSAFYCHRSSNTFLWKKRFLKMLSKIIFTSIYDKIWTQGGLSNLTHISHVTYQHVVNTYLRYDSGNFSFEAVFPDAAVLSVFKYYCFKLKNISLSPSVVGNFCYQAENRMSHSAEFLHNKFTNCFSVSLFLSQLYYPHTSVCSSIGKLKRVELCFSRLRFQPLSVIEHAGF